MPIYIDHPIMINNSINISSHLIQISEVINQHINPKDPHFESLILLSYQFNSPLSLIHNQREWIHLAIQTTFSV